MTKYAFLFPGQGAQAPGMIKDLAESNAAVRKCLDDISAVAGKDITKLLWETEAAELSRSDNSQLAITAASLAISAGLADKGITPQAAMGFSLGEFPALYAAGVLSFEDVIKVVMNRGRIMQNVCEKIAQENAGNPPGMTAVIGLSPEQVIDITSKIDNVYAANLNSTKQTVISGTAEGLTKAEEACKAAGARRALRLAVAGPFHCPLMQRAADEFEKAIVDVKFNDPKIMLFSNVTGKLETSGEQAKKSAVLHLTNPVRWTDEEAVLASSMEKDSGATWKLFEVGPGQVLSGLWAKSEFGEKWQSTSINTAETFSSAE